MTPARLSAILADLRRFPSSNRRLADAWGYNSEGTIRHMQSGRIPIPPERAAWLEQVAMAWELLERSRPR